MSQNSTFESISADPLEVTAEASNEHELSTRSESGIDVTENMSIEFVELPNCVASPPMGDSVVKAMEKLQLDDTAATSTPVSVAKIGMKRKLQVEYSSDEELIEEVEKGPEKETLVVVLSESPVYCTTEETAHEILELVLGAKTPEKGTPMVNLSEAPVDKPLKPALVGESAEKAIAVDIQEMVYELEAPIPFIDVKENDKGDEGGIANITQRDVAVADSVSIEIKDSEPQGNVTTFDFKADATLLEPAVGGSYIDEKEADNCDDGAAALIPQSGVVVVEHQEQPVVVKILDSKAYGSYLERALEGESHIPFIDEDDNADDGAEAPIHQVDESPGTETNDPEPPVVVTTPLSDDEDTKYEEGATAGDPVSLSVLTAPTNASRPSVQTGTVKWYDPKNGFGYITVDNSGEDVFVHMRDIRRMNPRHSIPSLSDGERVEFVVKQYAGSVTGLDRRAVLGSPLVALYPHRYKMAQRWPDEPFKLHREPRYGRRGDRGGARQSRPMQQQPESQQRLLRNAPTGGQVPRDPSTNPGQRRRRNDRKSNRKCRGGMASFDERPPPADAMER